MIRSTVGLPFELLESKLRPPRVSGRGIPRTALVEWALSREQRPFAWVSVDRHDNDPIVLLTYVAVALDRVAPIDRSVFEALASPGASVEATVVPRVGAALAAVDRPVVLGLDDVHAIENPQCIDAIVALAGHVPEGSRSSSGPTTSGWTSTRRESS